MWGWPEVDNANSANAAMLTGHVGLALEHVPAVLIVIGMAMMIFNLLSGRLADLFTSGKVTFTF